MIAMLSFGKDMKQMELIYFQCECKISKEEDEIVFKEKKVKTTSDFRTI